MFNSLIVIEPLGLLYGSAGRFLSPDNLVGRSGSSFPPSAATLSGIFVAALGKDNVKNLFIAGPFWSDSKDLGDSENQNFYVPTPKTYLVKADRKQEDRLVTGTIDKTLTWQSQTRVWRDQEGEFPVGKFSSPGWLAIQDWPKSKAEHPKKVCFSPWESITHLHPKLKPDERRVIEVNANDPNKPGSLFAEHSIQMKPCTCLVYLATHKLPDGWYRFGGEGHMVEITSYDIGKPMSSLLQQDLGNAFALITPAVWGSQRHSYRAPIERAGELYWSRDVHDNPTNQVIGLLTERPHSYRYRLGSLENAQPHEAKRLSRGRYAVPASSVYVVEQPIKAWHEWSEDLFPREGVSYKRWGCGLALPLPQAA
jgi:CRISPR-associated protein Cmr3